jgi:hypothetical protein
MHGGRTRPGRTSSLLIGSRSATLARTTATHRNALNETMGTTGQILSSWKSKAYQRDARYSAKCAEGSISRGWRSVTRAPSGIYGRVFEPGELAAHRPQLNGGRIETLAHGQQGDAQGL